jgi:serine/threonine protein kinase
MPIELQVTAGPNQGQIFTFDESTPITIGRGDGMKVRVNDPAVSRSHCVIEFTDGKTLVKDAGSRTGTRVNGRSVARHELRNDDEICVGTTKLKYQLQAPPAEEQVRRADAVDLDGLCQLAGTTFSHFKLGDVAGVGNTGVVFQAQDLKEERDLALKIYVPDFASIDEDLQRFIRAVKTMLPIRHPNLVTLFGGGKTGPHCWMAMEFVKGENLKQTIQRIGQGGKIDWRPALHVAIGVARGLFHLHSEKIIHRNLSPTNILFSKLGVAKMGSLILAKALSGTLARNVTMGNNVLGEVCYQAPEQVGAAGGVDGRADIYSLGALMYALLTGRPPFLGSSAIETASWILQRNPQPPRSYNPGIPGPLEEIVLKMLEKKPAERFQSAGELLDELEKLPSV